MASKVYITGEVTSETGDKNVWLPWASVLGIVNISTHQSSTVWQMNYYGPTDDTVDAKQRKGGICVLGNNIIRLRHVEKTKFST